MLRFATAAQQKANSLYTINRLVWRKESFFLSHDHSHFSVKGGDKPHQQRGHSFRDFICYWKNGHTGVFFLNVENETGRMPVYVGVWGYCMQHPQLY